MNGFYMNENTEFDGDQITFPKLLQNAGYQTSIIGKWHLASEPTGFDYWDILPGQGLYYRPEFFSKTGIRTEGGYVTDVITDKAIEWLASKRDQNRPFMLMVQHKAPHREWSPPIQYLDCFEAVYFPEPGTLFDNYNQRGSAAHNQDMSIRITMELEKDLKVRGSIPGNQFYQRVYSRLTQKEREFWDKNLEKRWCEYKDPELKGIALVKWKYQQYLRDYLACVRSLDDNVGELLDYLRESGLEENTVVIYSSDQGFYLGEHGWFDKRFMYDESYRTPLLVRWPGVVEASSKNKDLVSNLDFAQTFLDIAGVASDPGMQGMSIVPLLKGKKPENWRKYHYYHYYEYPGWHMVQRHEGVYDGRYKLIHFYDVNEWEFYDTKLDPNELHNQFYNSDYSDNIALMKGKLLELKEQYKVPDGIPNLRIVEDLELYLSPGQKAMGID